MFISKDEMKKITKRLDAKCFVNLAEGLLLPRFLKYVYLNACSIGGASVGWYPEASTMVLYFECDGDRYMYTYHGEREYLYRNAMEVSCKQFPWTFLGLEPKDKDTCVKSALGIIHRSYTFCLCQQNVSLFTETSHSEKAQVFPPEVCQAFLDLESLGFDYVTHFGEKVKELSFLNKVLSSFS